MGQSLSLAIRMFANRLSEELANGEMGLPEVMQCVMKECLEHGLIVQAGLTGSCIYVSVRDEEKLSQVRALVAEKFPYHISNISVDLGGGGGCAGGPF